MRKVAVITDSTAYIPKEVREAKHINMVPLNVVFGAESFQEETDLTTDFFYEKVRESKNLPKTSQPSIGLITKKLEELSKEHDDVIIVTLSSGISGTYQSAVSASTLVDDIKVHVFDSEISCMVQGFYVLEAVDMANEGKQVSEILRRLEEMKKSMRAYFMVDDLTNLHRGGRLNSAQALVGSMLQVKPLLHFENTKIVPYEKIRTQKRALKRLFQLFEEDAATGEKLKATLIHANREEVATALQQELSEKYPNADISISYFGPVIGTHLGEGAIGLGWYRL